jgi:adenine specific DNA methylase Mod
MASPSRISEFQLSSLLVRARKPSAVIDTRVILLRRQSRPASKLPDGCVDLIYIDPPFNSNRNYEVFWGETKEKRSFEDGHEFDQGLHRLHAPALRRATSCAKETGSFYYHCDWHASHYVKVMLDQIFGENQFINEILWKRQSAHSDAKQGSKHVGRVHDMILLYSNGNYTFKHMYRPYHDDYVEKFYCDLEPNTGRRYSLADITAPWRSAG